MRRARAGVPTYVVRRETIEHTAVGRELHALPMALSCTFTSSALWSLDLQLDEARLVFNWCCGMEPVKLLLLRFN